MPVKVTYLLLLLTLLFSGAWAQQEQYLSLKKYTQNDGLSSYNITKIVRDRLGYLWIGTQDGLNRFDGRDFQTFKDDPDARYRLFGNNVSDIIEDTIRNILWVSTSYGGITGIDINTSKASFHLPAGKQDYRLAGKWVRRLATLGDTLWIGTDQGLLAYDVARGDYLKLTKVHPELAKAGEGNINKLLVDQDRNLWIFSLATGLTILPHDKRKDLKRLSLAQLKLDTKEKKLVFWDIARTAKRRFAIATSLGIRIVSMSGDVLFMEPAMPGFYDREIFSCAVDEKGQYWFSDAEGLYRSNAEWRQVVKMKDADFSISNWQSSIYQIYPDEDHNIWLGCQEGLAVYRNQRSPFTAYSKSSRSDTKMQHVYSLLPVSDSIILCGAQDGIYTVNYIDRSIEQLDKGGAGFFMYRHSPSETFISNAHGLMIYNGKSLSSATTKYRALSPLKNDILNSAIRYNDSIVLFGSQLQKGVYVWNTVAARLTNFNNGNSVLGLYNNFCNTMYRDNAGKVWILSQSRVIGFNPVLNKTVVHNIRNPATGEYCPILFDMCQVGKHFYFAAYGLGVVETDASFQTVSVITTKDHLANNGVYKILSYKDSLLFITTNNGLSTLNLSTREIRTYYQSDGLHSSAFEEFSATEKDNRIYAGGVNGFTVIEPEWLSHNTVPPRLYLNTIRTESEQGEIKLFNSATSHIKVPSYILQTSFNFSCINYSNPDRVTFAYRIAGDSWIDMGHQNFINLVGITPGKYKLEVRAANEDGVWSTPVMIETVFMPKWFQSLWFKLAIAGGIVLLGWGLYHLRITRLKSEQEIRNRLANDLHDDLGSTLNSVKIYANLGLMEDEKDRYLEHIKQNTQEGIQSLKDMIWMISEKPETVQQMISKLTLFAEPLCKAKKIRLKTEIANEAYHYMLGQAEKQNLYLIGKEAVNNSIKYSEASEISIKVSFRKEKPIFTFADDGLGFKTALDTQVGNGLKNMKVRAWRIKYTIEIKNGAGAAIELRKW